MKGIYIYSTNDKDYKANGEAKKVLSQVNAFEKSGIEIAFFDVILDKKIDKLIYRLPFGGVYRKSIINQCVKEAEHADFIYIRKNIFDCTYCDLLRKLKISNPHLKIFVEIPTYPYFQEWGRIIDKPLIWKEKKTVSKVAKEHLVDYYLTLTNDDQIFGIPTIKFDNCIDVEAYTPKKCLQNPDELHLIGVALLAYWHGYDRVIEGLHRYYESNIHSINVVFHVVGDGPELPRLKQLVEQYKLGKHVIFEGKNSGDSLDHLYDISNVGIGGLGIYRKGLTNSRGLKLREYCAKGIPFISAGSDELFDNYPYCLCFSNNDEPIDIIRLVNWAAKIDYNKAVKDMRAYAVQHLDWKKFVSDIVESVKEN